MATSRAGKPIVIAEYDPQWPITFREERALILRTVGAELFERIEHVGSTAVAGLAAKPIIDIMPGVRTLEDVTPDVIARFASIGYEYVPEYERPSAADDDGMPFRRYFRKDRDGVRAFHLHLVEKGSEFWVLHLRFRNYLRVFTELRDEYADLKRAIAADYNAQMGATWGSTELNRHYTENKSEFVERVLRFAEERIAASDLIVLATHDPAWAERFERERALIAHAAGNLAAGIEHVGSTSVPGLPAKPQVDIALGLGDMADADALVGPLNDAGYGDPRHNDDDWIFYSKREEGADKVNLHVVPHDGRRWREYLLLRDYVRAHPDAARDYEALKRELAAEFVRDRIGYPMAKEDFVTEIVERARVWAARSTGAG